MKSGDRKMFETFERRMWGITKVPRMIAASCDSPVKIPKLLRYAGGRYYEGLDGRNGTPRSEGRGKQSCGGKEDVEIKGELLDLDFRERDTSS
jgi:hypothetical protein